MILELSIFAGVWLAALLSPGPDFFMTVQVAGSRGRAASVWTAFGITVGIAVWVTLAFAGLSIILEQFGWLSSVIRIGGAVCLVVFGLLMLREALAPGVEGQAAPLFGRMHPFWLGFTCNIANPKALVFWTSVFAATFPASLPMHVAALAIAAVLASCFGWFSLVGLAISSPRVREAYLSLKRWILGLGGGVFVSAGGRLAFEG